MKKWSIFLLLTVFALTVAMHPILLFVDGDGDIVAKTRGFHTAAELLEIGQKVAGNEMF